MEQQLKQQIERISLRAKKLEKKSRLISALRMLTFVILVAFLLIETRMYGAWLFAAIILILIGVFVFLVYQHRRVLDTSVKYGYLLEIKKEHLARISLDWDNIPKSTFLTDVKHHPFAEDLHIIGDRSLMQLIDTTIYDGSSRFLRGWLLTEEPEAAQVVKRQQLVKELQGYELFRDKLRVTAKFTKSGEGRGDWSMDDLIRWLQKPAKTGFKLPLLLLSLNAVVNIVFGVMALRGQLGIIPFIVSFLIYLLISRRFGSKSEGLFDAVYQVEKLLTRFSAILLHVERFRFKKNGSVKDFVRIFQDKDNRPSAYLKKINRLAAGASMQHNQLIGPLLNFIVPWDLYFSMIFEGLKHELQPKLSRWTEGFYQLEALGALANFADLNPDYAYPEFEAEQAYCFEAAGLGHPLIKKENKVTNNFRIGRQKQLFLLTGSNMAGKSTFLRTVGINLVLAYAGAPVSAAGLKTSFYRIFTSINVGDSLDDGLSHFYAEVKRLRLLLDALNETEKLPLFYFVDEIYRGTNNKERYLGSRAFMHAVADKPAVGIITSHDLELAELVKEIPNLNNYHFSELIEDGKMKFDYTLKPGVSPSTNALSIMRMEGLPT